MVVWAKVVATEWVKVIRFSINLEGQGHRTYWKDGEEWRRRLGTEGRH